MLPDTLHKLPRDERFAYARLLAYMARVDDEITVDELAMFEQRIGTALLSPNQRDQLRRALKNPPPLEEILEDLGPESGRLALRDTLLMATADGSIDGDEYDVLQEIADHLGLAENAVTDLIEWAKKGYGWMEEGVELLNTLKHG